MKREIHLVTSDEVDRMLRLCKPTFAGTRDRCAIILMYRLGLRAGEVLGLNVGDIRLIDGDLICRVERPKGYRRENGSSPPRELLLDPTSTDAYQDWMTHRGIDPGALFVNRRRERVSARYCRRRLAELQRRAGVEGRVHPHGLRHSFADVLYRQTRDVRVTQRALGHSSLSTTAVYLSRVGSAPEVIEAMRGIEW